MRLPLADFSAIRRAFANRNYAVYAAGNSVSLIGFWVQRVAVGWLAWDLTKSGLWLGAVAFADLAPAVVIGPWAGALADRIERRRILLICQSLLAAQAGVLSVLTVLGLMTVELLFALTLLQGVVIAFNQPARLSLVPDLVRGAELSTALAIGSVIFNLARFIGPAVAGMVISWFGVAPAFAVNAFSYVAMIAALVSLRLPLRVAPPRPARGVAAEVGEGVRYAFTHPAIGPLLLLVLGTSLLARPVFELLPGFAESVFGRGPGGLAVLTAAVGFGAIGAGAWLAQRGRLAGLTGIVLAAVTAAGALVTLFAVTGVFWLATAAMAMAGFALSVFGIGTQTLIQSAVAGHMRGRVMSLWGLIFRGGPALGALAMGWLSGYFGLGWPLAVGGALSAGAGFLAWSRRATLASRFETAEPPGPG